MLIAPSLINALPWTEHQTLIHRSQIHRSQQIQLFCSHFCQSGDTRTHAHARARTHADRLRGVLVRLVYFPCQVYKRIPSITLFAWLQCFQTQVFAFTVSQWHTLTIHINRNKHGEYILSWKLKTCTRQNVSLCQKCHRGCQRTLNRAKNVSAHSPSPVPSALVIRSQDFTRKTSFVIHVYVTFLCPTADLKGNTQRYYEIHSVLPQYVR
jgi:hypothetical protein